jgi:preprotein translocase subunit SecE
MARNRQRSKQRQAERRARRLQAERAGGAETDDAQARAAEPALDEPVPGDGGPAVAQERPTPVTDDPGAAPVVPGVDDPRAAEPAPGIDPALAVGAPPTDEGRSGPVVEEEPELAEAEHLTDEELADEEEAEVERGYAPRGRRGAEAPVKERPRFVQFLIAVWAELQRVQWPNRQALTTLTGVVLGFVLIAGGYLGLLDSIFSRIIKAIL